jgi:hypothetical protein
LADELTDTKEKLENAEKHNEGLDQKLQTALFHQNDIRETEEMTQFGLEDSREESVHSMQLNKDPEAGPQIAELQA